jgi:hypothetical protein
MYIIVNVHFGEDFLFAMVGLQFFDKTNAGTQAAEG